MALIIDVTEGEMAGRQSLVIFNNAEWDFIFSSGLITCHGFDDLFYLVDIHISIKKEFFRYGYSRWTNELTCASHWNCSARELIF